MIKLEYIKSSGTLYIDTGFIPNLNTRVVLDLVAEATSSTTSGYLCGARTSGSSNQFAILTRTNYYAARYGTQETTIYNGVVSNRLIIDMNKNVFTVNGTSITLTSETFECPVTFTLFDINNNGEIPYSPLNSIKLYSCRIYDNEVLVRDFIPMATDTGECGLWDNIEEKFYVSPNGEKFEGIREDNGMPVGYFLCEYIQSSGLEYIDTGFIPNQDTRVVMDAKPFSMSTNGSCMFGVRNTSTSNSYNAYIIASGYWWGYATAYSQVDASNVYNRVVFDANKNILTVTNSDENIYTISLTYQSFTAPHSLILLALWSNETSGIYSGTLFIGKMYSCQIYDNGTLVRDYIPVMRLDGTFGLYDKVENKFYSSPNGINFLGKVIENTLGTIYTECDWIESDGTQYIDTLFKPNLDTRIIMDCNIMGGSNYPTAYGAWSSTNIDLFICLSYSESLTWFYFGTNTTKAQISILGRHILEENKISMYIDETLVGTSATASFSCSNSLYLCSLNDSGTPRAINMAAMRIYSCQIYDNGELTRDYVPCVNKYNGTFGLYDKVNNVFYPSKVGNFNGKITGEELPNGYTPCEYIESTGTLYIDTKVIGKTGIKAEMDFILTSYGASIPLGCYSPQRHYLVNITDTNLFRYGYVDWVTSSNYAIPGVRYNTVSDFASGNQSLIVNGETVATSTNTTNYTNNYNIFAFAYNDAGTAGDFSKMRLYSLKLYDNGTLVRDFIPVIDITGKFGLWDKVTENLYISPNGLLFNGLKEPIKYIPCEYIQSFGLEYIDTEFKPNNNTRVVMDADLGNSWDGSFPCLFGVGTTSGAGSSDKFMLFIYGSIKGFHDHYGSQTINPPYENGLGRHVFDKNKNVTKIDDTVISTFNSATFQHASSLPLFAALDGGNMGYYSKIKVYSCQIYDNETLVRDFIPVLLLATKEYCLYDKLNDIFYNTSIGAFSGKWLNNYELKVTPAELRQRLFNKVFIKGGLPAGYWECEYIESNGTLYIDTGFVPNQNTRVVADMQMMPRASYDDTFLFGTRASSTSNAFTVAYTSTQAFYNFATTYGYATMDLYKRVTIDANRNVATFTNDTNSNSITCSSGTFTAPTSLWVCASYVGSESMNENRRFRGRVYSYQIYDNDVLVQDCIPCISPNGIYGMFDKINKVFYPSATSSQFSGFCKRDIIGLPDGYEYIDGVYTNGNAYINTGFNPNTNTRAIIDIDIEASSSQLAVFGSRQAYATNGFLVFTATGNGWQYDYGNKTVNGTSGIHDDRQVIDINKNVLSINGAVHYTHTANTFTSSYPLYLGSINNGGSAMTSYPVIGTIYSCKIYDNGTLVRDYIPCIDTDTNILGLYDKVNNTFNPSIGTSEFGAKALYKADFTYTGSVQSVTLSPGTYKLQCWGALGGGIKYGYLDVIMIPGSKGGYSEGVLTLTDPKTLYIFVGGRGTNNTLWYTESPSLVNGGWNGGGAAVKYSSYGNGYSNPAPGGGSTDIALTTSSMSYSSGRTNRSTASLKSRFIVAGGGAGASYALYNDYKESLEEGSNYFRYLLDNGSEIAWEASYGSEGKNFIIEWDLFAGNVDRIVVEIYSDDYIYDYGSSTIYNSEYDDGICRASFYVQHSPNDYITWIIIYGSNLYYYGFNIYVNNSTGSETGYESKASQQGGGTSGCGQYPGTLSSGGNGNGNDGGFGYGGSQIYTNCSYCSGGAGSGWYGGGTAISDSSTSYLNYTGGGSGFVNTSANASYRPSGYTGLQLDSGTTIAGNTSFPSISGGTETGHSGNGYARITQLS